MPARLGGICALLAFVAFTYGRALVMRPNGPVSLPADMGYSS